MGTEAEADVAEETEIETGSVEVEGVSEREVPEGADASEISAGSEEDPKVELVREGANEGEVAELEDAEIEA